MMMEHQPKAKAKSPIKSIFNGELPTDSVFPFPSFPESEVETLALVETSLRRFLSDQSANFVAFDRKGEQSEHYLNELRDLGLFGLIIPEAFGGLGLSARGYAKVLQVISEYDGSTGLTVGAHSSIGMKGLLLFGSEEQRQRYLPRLATGELVAAFCLTEPGAGSDAQSIRTRVQRTEDGEYILNGEKIWITNGAFARLFTVFARHEDEGDKISAFVVEREWPGVAIGPKEDKMGIRASATTSISFTDVKVPAVNLLGKEGDGFRIAMAILNSGRTGLGGGCVGAMRRCLKLSYEHASQRKQFGKTLIEFPLIQEKLALMSARCFATESVVEMVGAMIDNGSDDYSLEAAASKIYGTESLWYVANEALQIAGGIGFMREMPYEMIVRDSRINMIFEGTNEILRLYVALSGIKALGDQLKAVSAALGSVLQEPVKGLGMLSDYAWRYLPVTGFGSEPVDAKLPESLAALFPILEHGTRRLSRAAEEIVKHYRRDVVQQQVQLRRLADAGVDLFVALCVLARVSSAVLTQGEEVASPHIDLARLIVQESKRRVAQSIRRLSKNEDELLPRIVAGYAREFGGRG